MHEILERCGCSTAEFQHVIQMNAWLQVVRVRCVPAAPLDMMIVFRPAAREARIKVRPGPPVRKIAGTCLDQKIGTAWLDEIRTRQAGRKRIHLVRFKAIQIDKAVAGTTDSDGNDRGAPAKCWP